MSLCQFYNCGVIYVKIMGMIGNKQTLMNFSNNTILGTVHKYLGGGGGWKISILVRENFFDPPLALPKTFLTPLPTNPKLFWPPLPMYPKLFWPPPPRAPETFWEWCCQETWVSDYFCYFDVLSNHWCSQTNLEKTWTGSFWYTSTLGHYEEGKGKNLFWRIDGVGATYTDSFIWTWIHTT